ncbi:MAG TPA: hypothetical protein VFT95_05480 [Micromonosporaceae bacterium]|nr:hypothetical protein [Micromonosporaceae bacterium]
MTGWKDRPLLGELRGMWTRLDPMPTDLVDRVLFTLRLEDLEVELMRLHEAAEPAGARGGPAETAGMITFSSRSLTVMLAVTGDGADLRRVDGWLAPAATLRIDVRVAGGADRDTVADEDGRFAFEAPAGLIQLVIRPTEGATLALDRPVATPAVQL